MLNVLQFTNRLLLKDKCMAVPAAPCYKVDDTAGWACKSQ